MKKSKLIVKLAMDKAELEEALLDAGADYDNFAHNVQANRVALDAIIEEQRKEIEALKKERDDLREQARGGMRWEKYDPNKEYDGDGVVYRYPPTEVSGMQYLAHRSNGASHALILTDPDGMK